MEELLDETELAAASDERWLEPCLLECALPGSRHSERAPELNRLGLAFQLVAAGVFVRDRSLRGPLRRVADEHGPRLCRRLDPRGSVDEVAGDHPLALGTEGDGGFAR